MAEAPRNLQLPSGYDEEFVYEVEDDFICLICHLPLKEPVLTRCGHRFCRACFEEHLRRQEVQNQPHTCPADRKGLDRDRDVFPDNATGRKILSMVLKCPSDGCLWTGELRDKEAHLEACPFKIVTCTNENCHLTVKRKDLEQHVTNTCEWRIMECEYCEEPHPKRHLQDHLENCSKIPLPCPNSCGDLILREMIPNHIDNDCPLSLVSCPYAQMGCVEKFQRKSVDSHLQSNMQEHLDLACVTLNSTQVQLDEQQVQLDETRAQLVETQAKLSRLTQDQLRNFQESQETTRKLKEKIGVLQRQIDVKVNTDKEGGNKRFIWKIKLFSQRLKQAKAGVKERIESDPFYTGCYGYKFKVFAHPCFTVRVGCFSSFSSYLSIGVVLTEGEYDDMLPWPFSKKIKCTIIDQNEDLKERQDFAKYLQASPSKQQGLVVPSLTLSRPGGYWASSGQLKCFISHETLQTRRYIVNDTLFLQVDLEEPND